MIGKNGEGLVFLLGLPRSGTTLLSALLDNHKDVVCPPEPWIGLALESVGFVSPDHPADARLIGQATQDFLGEQNGCPIRDDAVRSFATTAYNGWLGEGKVFVDKTPRYWQIIDQLDAWFPECKYIYLRRNPFDVASSYLKTWSFDIASHISRDVWSSNVLDFTVGLPVLEEFRQRAGDRLHTLSYEDLVSDSVREMAEVYSFLSLPAGNTIGDGAGADREGMLLGDGVRRVTASVLGDKNILKSTRVHSESVGSGIRTFSDEQLRSLYGAVGRDLLVDMGYLDIADLLRVRGIRAPGKAKTSKIRARGEQVLAERWSRSRAWSDLSLGMPPELEAIMQNLREQQQSAQNERAVAVEQRDALVLERTRFVEEHEKLTRDHKDLIRIHEGVTGEFKGLARDHETAHAQVLELNARFESVSDKLSRSRIECELLSNRLSEGKCEHETVQNRLVEMESSSRSLETELVAVKRERDRTEADYLKGVERADLLEDQLAKERQESESCQLFLGNEISRLHEEAQTNEQELLEQAERERGKLQGAIDAAEEHLGVMKVELLDQAERERGELQGAIDAAEEHLGVTKVELQRVYTEYDRLAMEQRRRFFGSLGFKARLAHRFRMFVERSISVVGPRPVQDWPSVTVVVRCMNDVETVGGTIESALGQGYPGLQLVVVDCGSTDGSLDVIQKYTNRVELVNCESRESVFAAFDCGVQDASGEVVGWLLAGEIFQSGGLFRIAEAFRERTGMMVSIHEGTGRSDGIWVPDAQLPKELHLYDLLYGGIDGVRPRMWMRCSAYARSGGFDSRFGAGGGYDLMLRLSLHFRILRGAGHVVVQQDCAECHETDIELFRDDVKRSRDLFREKTGYLGLIGRFPRFVGCRLSVLMDRLQSRRWHYPINERVSTASEHVYRVDPAHPRCPLSSRPPDRLLFSSRSAEGDRPVLRRVWRCDSSDSALIESAVAEPSESGSEAGLVGVQSPYLGFKGAGKISRLAHSVRLPEAVLKQLVGIRPQDLCDSQIDSLLWILRGPADAKNQSVRFLGVDCSDGTNEAFLDGLKARTSWKLSCSESGPSGIAAAEERGYRVFDCAGEELWWSVPEGEEFDVIYLAHGVEQYGDPYALMRRLKNLLGKGGMVVFSTPSLDSWQLSHFGPTWSPWHVRETKSLFGARGLRLLGRNSGYSVSRIRSYSVVQWTACSAQMNMKGVDGALSSGHEQEQDNLDYARSVVGWSRLLWDWRGKGDFQMVLYRVD